MAQPEKRRSLGRGLSALIPPKPPESAPMVTTTSGRGLATLPISHVLPSDGQPRQHFDDAALNELAESIKLHGILQPVVVRQRAPDQYELIAGERRWRAAQRAGLTEIEAVISNTAPEETLTLALVENLQRRDLNVIEEADAYERLTREMGYSQAEIADAVGKDRSTVANALRLLKLPLDVRQFVVDDALSMGHARALLGLELADAISKAAKEVVKQGFSVRQTEAMVNTLKSASDPDESAPQKKPKKSDTPESDAERDVRLRLQRALGTKVELKHKQGVGTLVVHFAGYDALDAILARVGA